MTKFSSQTLQKRPMMTVGEILDKKYDDIHDQMYHAALSAYFAAYNPVDYDYSYDYKCIEIPAAYYDNASKVQVISKTYPYKRFTVDLSPYWGEYMFKDKASYTSIDTDEMTVKTAEIKYRDYVKGYAEMESRLTGVKYTVSLKDVPNDIREYPDDKSMENTFAYLVNNKIYGDER